MRFRMCVAIASLSFSLSALAGPYSDDLAKCMVESATKEDRQVFAQWMVAAMAQSPSVSSMVNVSAESMDKANAAAAAMATRLVTEACKDKAKKALRYEGAQVMPMSFSVLGEALMNELFSSPEVRKAMAGLDQKFDKKKLEELKNP